jgi:dCMP deaminase
MANSWVANPNLPKVYAFTDIGETSIETFYAPKDKKMDLVYLKMAEVWATNSYCKRMQVGSLIVKNKSIISDGYNGSPTGFPNKCEDKNNITLDYVLHAEANAITKLAKSTQSSDGSTLYVTVSPCYECSKLIIQSGIKRLVFKEVYRKPESLQFLFNAGIEIIRIKKTT